MLLSIVFYLLIIISFVGIFFTYKKKLFLPIDLLIKVLSIVLYASILIKGLASDSFVGVINGGLIYAFEYYVDKMDLPESLIRWGFLASECLIASLLISKSKQVKWILSYVSLPLIMLGIIYFPFSIQYYLNPIDFGFYLISPTLACILTIIEYLSLFAICFIIHLFDNDKKINSSQEGKQTIKIGLFSLFVCIPFLTYASIFGTTQIEIESFNYAHISWLIITILILVGTIILFKKEDENIRFTILAIMVFFLVWHILNSFKVSYCSNRFPLQLCNLAPFLFLIILLTKNQKIFDFVVVANPVGAIVALLVTETGNIFNFWMIHYIVEHTYVLIIPILFIYLGYMKTSIFKNMVKNYFIVFTIYFMVCLFTNTIHNGIIYNNYGSDVLNSVNFFFMIECPLSSLPFYPYLLFGRINMFNQEIFFGYLLFIYVVFSILGFIFYFIPVGIIKLKNVIISKREA